MLLTESEKQNVPFDQKKKTAKFPRVFFYLRFEYDYSHFLANRIVFQTLSKPREREGKILKTITITKVQSLHKISFVCVSEFYSSTNLYYTNI